jgi:hypothetical protein
MEETRILRVVVFRGNHYWVAQCLDINLAAQGPDLEQLAERFANTLKAHITISRERGVEPFALRRADQRYWDMWAEALRVEAREAAHHEERTQRETFWNRILASFDLGGMRAALAFE